MPTEPAFSDIDLAVMLFKQMVSDPRRCYWGTSLTDAKTPIVSAWDSDTETIVTIMCYADANQRERVIKSLTGVLRERYRDGQFVTGYTAFVFGNDGVLEEVDWEPDDNDRESAALSYRLYDEKHEQLVALLKKQGLWRLGEFERRADAIMKGRDPDAPSLP